MSLKHELIFVVSFSLLSMFIQRTIVSAPDFCYWVGLIMGMLFMFTLNRSLIERLITSLPKPEPVLIETVDEHLTRTRR